MSVIIEIYRGEICAICREDFSPGERQFTHVGGEGHSGFHRKCLARWVSLNPTCPLDRMPIDPRSILSRTERIMAKLRPALVNGAYAMFFVVASEGASGAVGAAVGLRGSVALAEIFKKMTAVAAAVGSAGTGAVVAFNPGMREAKSLVLFGGLLAVMGSVIGAVIGTKISGVAEKIEQVAWATLCNGAAFGTGAALGRGIVHHRGDDEIARGPIGMGLYVAGLVTMMRLNDPTGGTITPLSLFSISGLVAGVTAGILSLIRR